MKKLIILSIFLGVSSALFSSAFDKGKDAFLNNKPAEAMMFFEQAVEELPDEEDVFMYLGLSYVQNGLGEKAVNTFIKGAELAGSQEGRFYLNAANVYYSMENTEEALFLYDRVIEGEYEERASAMLNRANIHMTLGDLEDAAQYYKDYLVADPESSQKEKILQVISLIEGKIAEEKAEAARLAAEAERLRLEEERKKAEAAAEAERQRLEDERRRAEAAAEAERVRLAEEKRKADEAARQKALMDEILNSLSSIGKETQNIAADSESIEHTDEDSDIDD